MTPNETYTQNMALLRSVLSQPQQGQAVDLAQRLETTLLQMQDQSLQLAPRQLTHWQTLSAKWQAHQPDSALTGLLQATQQNVRAILAQSTSATFPSFQGLFVKDCLGYTHQIQIRYVDMNGQPTMGDEMVEVCGDLRDRGDFLNTLKLALRHLTRWIHQNLKCRIFLSVDLEMPDHGPVAFGDGSAGLLMLTGILGLLLNREPFLYSASGMVYKDRDDFGAVEGFELPYGKLEAAFDAGVEKLIVPSCMKQTIRRELGNANAMGVQISEISEQVYQYAIGNETMQIIFVNDLNDILSRVYQLDPENLLPEFRIKLLDPTPPTLQKHVLKKQFIAQLNPAEPPVPRTGLPKSPREFFDFWTEQLSDYSSDKAIEVLNSLLNYFPWETGSEEAFRNLNPQPQASEEQLAHACLLIHGKSGTGKSNWLIQKAKQELELGKRVFFFKAEHLFRRSELESIQSELEKFVQMPDIVLCIDGLEDSQPADKSTKEAIIDTLLALRDKRGRGSRILLTCQDNVSNDFAAFSSNARLKDVFYACELAISPEQYDTLKIPAWCQSAFWASVWLNTRSTGSQPAANQGLLLQGVLSKIIARSLIKGHLHGINDERNLNVFLQKLALLLTDSGCLHLPYRYVSSDFALSQLASVPVLTVQQQSEQIAFSHPLLQAYYTALAILEQPLPENWRDLRWRESMLLAADLMLNELQLRATLARQEVCAESRHQLLIDALIHHILSARDEVRFQQISHAINTQLDVKNAFGWHLDFAESTTHYRKAEYIKSIARGAQALQALPAGWSQAGLLNQLASCYLDLYALPQALILIDKGLVNSAEQEPRLRGTRARVHMKNQDWIQARQDIQFKLDWHSRKSRQADVLRDRNDQLLLEVLIYQQHKGTPFLFEIFTKYEELKQEMLTLQKNSGQSKAMDLMFLRVNMSYSLPVCMRESLLNASALPPAVSEMMLENQAILGDLSHLNYPISMLAYQMGSTYAESPDGPDRAVPFLEAAYDAFSSQIPKLPLYQAAAAQKLALVHPAKAHRESYKQCALNALETYYIQYCAAKKTWSHIPDIALPSDEGILWADWATLTPEDKLKRLENLVLI